MVQLTLNTPQASSPRESEKGRIEREPSFGLEELYDRTAPRVFGLLLKILERRSAAEEVVLDVYTQAWREGHFESETDAEERLLQLARSRGIEQLRNTGGHPVTEPPTVPMGTVAGENKPPGEGEPRDIWGSLDLEDRTALELAFYFGLNTGEIALQLKLPREAVRRRLAEALSRLHQALQDQRRGER